MTPHTFSISKKKQKDTVVDEDELIDLDEDKVNEWEDMYNETETSKFIEGDFAVIKTGDDHAYNLLKLTSPYESKCEVTNDYKHSFQPFHSVVEGNYLEVMDL